jgi:adenosine deaminase
MNIQDFIQQLPKTDLHCHLDGSMRVQTVHELAKEAGLSIAKLSLDELKKELVCGEKVTSLPDFLKAFKITSAVMLTENALKRIAFELVEDAAKENVRRLEIRYYPGWMTEGGLKLEQVILAVESGIEQAKKKYSIEVGTILCAIRIFSPEESEKMARLAVEMKSHGVVGFDLVHAERGNPAKNHRKAFDIAAKAGLGITVHAGEDEASWSIEDAIDYCHAQRIGHGRTLIEDEKLIQKVIDKNIAIEACPSSNVQIGLTSEFSQHPLKKLLEKGVRVTLNTDNRLLTGILVSDEYLRCHQFLGMDEKQLTQMAANGFEASFLKS